MRTRTAFAISGGLALLLALPVLAVIALGVYGEASVTTGAGVAGSADLVVSPAHGLPGSEIVVRGSNWPPRSLVSVYLGRPAGGLDSAEHALRLASVIASRSGAFEVEHVIPAAVLPPGVIQVFFEAMTLSHEGREVRADRVAFAVDPYPTLLRVHVVDRSTGAEIGGAQIQIEDALGRQVATGVAGERGEALFRGIPPGLVKVTSQQIDHLPGAAELTVAALGDSAVEVGLARSPRLRLYAPGAVQNAAGALSWIGIDRASGLTLREPAPSTTAALRRRLDPKRALTFDYLIPVSGDGEGRGIARAAFESLGVVDELLSGVVPAYPTSVRFSGVGAGGLLVFSSYGEYTCSGCTGLYLLDVNSAVIRRRITLPPEMLPPILSRDGSKVYLLNWSFGDLEIRDLPAGTVTGRIHGIPPLVTRAVLEPSGEGLLLLSALRGAVYRLDLGTGAVSGPIVEAPGSVDLGALADGRILLLRPRFDDLVAANGDGSNLIFIPLDAQASWLWVDPRGPFIYVGRVVGPEETEVTLLDATLRIVGRVELPYAANGVGGS